MRVTERPENGRKEIHRHYIHTYLSTFFGWHKPHGTDTDTNSRGSQVDFVCEDCIVHLVQS